MLKNRPDTAVPLRQIAQVGVQKVEALANFISDHLYRQLIGPGRGQQNAQRHALYQTTNPGNGGVIGPDDGNRTESAGDVEKVMREMTFTGDFGGLRDGRELTRAQKTLRIGAVCAILGALISVAAGIGFGNLTNEAGVETVMRYLTSLPRWYWPAAHLSFMFGAVLISYRSAFNSSLR